MVLWYYDPHSGLKGGKRLIDFIKVELSPSKKDCFIFFNKRLINIDINKYRFL